MDISNQSNAMYIRCCSIEHWHDAEEQKKLGLQHFRRWKWLVQLAVTSLLLAAIFKQVDLSSLSGRLENLRALPVAAAVLITLFQFLIYAIRWRRILNALGPHLGLSIAIRTSFGGLFINQFIPSSVAGDVYRGVVAHRLGLSAGLIASSLLLDRAVTLAALFILGLLTLPLLNNIAGIDDNLRSYTLFIIAAIICMLLAVIALRKIRTLAHSASDNKLLGLLRQIGSLLDERRVMYEAVILSLLIHLLSALSLFLLSEAIGGQIHFFYFIVITPMIALATVLPITLAGWGAREVTMVGLFTVLHLDTSVGLAISLLAGMLVLACSLPGVFAISGLRLAKEP